MQRIKEIFPNFQNKIEEFQGNFQSQWETMCVLYWDFQHSILQINQIEYKTWKLEEDKNAEKAHTETTGKTINSVNI